MQDKMIGEKIREYRLKKGLTQDTLAAELHISSQAVSKWETGQTMPDISLLVPLSKVLEVGVNELLGGDRRAEHERIWQRALAFGEELTLLAAEDAVKEFPDDETFLYRRACDEYHIGTRKDITRAKAYQYLGRAARHFSDLHIKYPEDDNYTSWLADVYLARGERDRALDLALTIKDTEKQGRYVAKCLGGDEEKRFKQKKLKKRMDDLYYYLLELNTRESIDAAHSLLEVMMPEGKALRNRYWDVFIKDACLCLDEGDVEGYEEKLTMAYETVMAYDKLPRELLKYPDPLFDRLQNDRDKPLEIYAFMDEFLYLEKLDHPASLKLKRRIVEEHLTYHRLWRHEWIAFYQFCRDHICGGSYLNFGTSFNVTDEEEKSGMESFFDKREHGNEGLIEYYKHEIERLVGGGKMRGFVAHTLNLIFAYCNCGDKTEYARLPIPDEYRAVPEGARVLSIVDIMVMRNFENCGIEKRLLEHALEWSKKDGFTHAEVYIRDRMVFEEDSKKFDELVVLYEKFGFAILHDLTENGKRQYIMQKEL